MQNPTTMTTLEPIIRKDHGEAAGSPARTRWVQSGLLLLMFVAILLPVSHGAFTTSKPATATTPAIEQRAVTEAEPSYAHEGYRHRDPEAGTFLEPSR